MNIIKTNSNNGIVIMTGCGCTDSACGCVTENKKAGTRTYTANSKVGGKNQV